MEQVLYELPKGWKWETLDVLTKVQSGTGFPKKYQGQTDEEFPFLKVSDMNLLRNESKIVSWNNSISSETVSEIKAKIMPMGTVIFPKIGAAIATNKKRIITIPCAFDNNVMGLEAREGLTSDYLYWYLQGFDLSEWASSAALPSMKASTVREHKIPLPPLNEQKRIVEKLDALFTHIHIAISHLQQTLELSKALFASALSAGFKNESGDWLSVKLDEVCSITSKLSDPRESEYLDMIHVGGANIESLTGILINLKTAREEKLISGKFPFDDQMVLYSKIRPYLMKVARPDIVGLCSADIYPLIPKADTLCRDFLFYLLLSEHFTEYAIQGSSRAGMPKVNREHLFKFQFSLPPLQEQRRIVTHLDALDEHTRALKAATQEKINNLATLKASLLDAAFKGQL